MILLVLADAAHGAAWAAWLRADLGERAVRVATGGHAAALAQAGPPPEVVLAAATDLGALRRDPRLPASRRCSSAGPATRPARSAAWRPSRRPRPAGRSSTGCG